MTTGFALSNEIRVLIDNDIVGENVINYAGDKYVFAVVVGDVLIGIKHDVSTKVIVKKNNVSLEEFAKDLQ